MQIAILLFDNLTAHDAVGPYELARPTRCAAGLGTPLPVNPLETDSLRVPAGIPSWSG